MIHDDFLLHNPTGRRLFHEVARGLPIVDYHNHLDPGMLAGNLPFTDLTDLWVRTDPYKHRAMRIHGVPERFITGSAEPYAKFERWAATVPATWGNPLHHWNALELKRVFGIDESLQPDTARSIWERAGERLNDPDLRPQSILRNFGVETLCTSDDLLADLSLHQRASAVDGLHILPSLRGDTIVGVGHAKFPDWVGRLEVATGLRVHDLSDYLRAVDLRLDAFSAAGGVLADHALNSGWRFVDCSRERAETLFRNRLMDGMTLSAGETEALRSYLLVRLGQRYAARGWGLQLHVGAQRRTSARLRRLAGKAGGYASIGSTAHIESIATLLDAIEQGGGLPDVILYTLNPADNAAFASLTGSFAEDGRPGKVQFGPAWWYNDQLSGIRDHLNTVASYGLLHHFIGFTTDSRSVMSFSRHEYFRRILCNLLGEWTESGHLPPAGDWVNEAVTNICHGNACRWLHRKIKTHAPSPVE
jgi:glucuronate isomerase